MNNAILYLVDEAGAIKGVQLSPELWKKAEKLVLPLLEEQEASEVQREGPLKDFQTLMEYWDFSYPYSPRVRCPHCGACVDDWRSDEKHTFILNTANLGGLLVFHCTRCGTTIRHKHFKDHMSIEHTIPAKYTKG